MGQKHTLKLVSLRSALFGMPEPLLHRDSRAPAPYGHSPTLCAPQTAARSGPDAWGPRSLLHKAFANLQASISTKSNSDDSAADQRSKLSAIGPGNSLV